MRIFQVYRWRNDRRPTASDATLGSASPTLVWDVPESLAGRTGLVDLAGARGRSGRAMTERRYGDEEVALILHRAAVPSPDDPAAERGDGLTLAQLKEIGAEAGIDPARVERAARSVAADGRARPITGEVLGMPTTVQLERVVPAELDAQRLPDLLHVIRSEFARQGIVEEVLGGFEWRARSAMGGRYVSIRAEDGRTRIRVLGNYRDGMLVACLGVGPIATMGTGALAVALGAATPFLFVPAALAGGLLAAFGPWKYAFRREERTLHRVLETLAEKVEDG